MPCVIPSIRVGTDTMALYGLLPLLAALPATAQTISWVQPVVGRWNQAACWSPATVPDGPTAIAEFPLGGGVLQVDIESRPSIRTLRVINPEARLFVNTNWSLTLREAGSIDGTLNLRSGSLVLEPLASGGVPLDGSGTIRLVAGAVFVTPGSVGTIGPSLRVHGNGYLQGTFTVLGTIETEPKYGSRIQLIGTFEHPSNGGLLQTTDGELALDGIARRIPVQTSSIGRMVLRNGTLEQVRVRGNVISMDADTLRDSEINGWLRIGGDPNETAIRSSRLTLEGSNRVDGTFDLLSADKNDTIAELFAPTTTTLDGVATLRLFGPTTNPSLARIVAAPGATLALGPGIVTQGTGEFRGNVLMAGRSEIGPGGTFGIQDGTLARVDSGSIAVGTGTIRLVSGTIDGFTLDASASPGIVLDRLGTNGGPSSIRRCTISGHVENRSGESSIDQSAVSDLEVLGGTVTLRNAAKINGPTIVGNRPGFSSGSPRLVIDDSSGRLLSGDVRLRPTTTSIASATIAAAADQVTTLGPNAHVRGSGTITGAWNIQGRVTADQTLPLTIDSATIAAAPGARLVADAGDIEILRSTIDGVSFRALGDRRIIINQASGGSSFPPMRLKNVSIDGNMFLRGGTADLENVNVEGTLSVAGTATLQVLGNRLDVRDALDIGDAVAPGPAVRFAQSIRLDRPALIRLRTPLNTTPPFASLDAALGTEVTLGPDVAVRGKGRLIGRFRVEGTLAPDAAANAVTRIVNDPPNPAPNLPPPAADLILTPTSVVELDVLSATASDQITGRGIRLDGTLRVKPAAGYVPQPATRHLIITGGATQTTIPSIAGTFARVEASGDFVATPVYSTSRVEVRIARRCPADLNRDGVVDDNDVSVLLESFNLVDCAVGSMPLSCQADLNADGIVNEGDFYLFLSSYDAMLCPA